jgi:sirohydrochlorin ferrochelatase
MSAPPAVRRAIVLIDHGSKRPEANATLEAVAAALRRRVPERIVEIAHMELAPPTLADAVAACVAVGAREIVVHPYFLAPGAHATRDIPAQAAAVAARHPDVSIRVSEPLGVHDGLLDAILARVDSA